MGGMYLPCHLAFPVQGRDHGDEVLVFLVARMTVFMIDSLVSLTLGFREGPPQASLDCGGDRLLMVAAAWQALLGRCRALPACWLLRKWGLSPRPAARPIL